MSSSIAEELTTSEPRLLRNFSATINLGAIALRRRAPRWVRPRQALRQPQRPCPTNLPQKPAVTLDCFREQFLASCRFPTPIDAVPPVPSQRVQSLLPITRGPSTEVPRSDVSTTSAPAARFDGREGSSFELYQRRDSYNQPLQQAGRYWAFGSQLPIMPPVSVYLAASPSADRPSAEHPQEPLGEEIEQLSAQLERAKALKAATAASQQQAAPSRRFVEPPTSYGSLYDKYAVPISSSVTSYDPGVPLVASAGRYTYADARQLERSYSFGGARTFERPLVSVPLMVAPSTPPPSASTFDTVAASLPALAAPVAALQASHAALQVAVFCY